MTFSMRPCLVAACMVVTGWTAGAAANERAASLATLHEWYAALTSDPASAAGVSFFGGILADDGEVRLNDFGIVQTSEEFVGSLTELSDAMRGAALAWRIEEQDFPAETVPVIVCYMFPGNEYMTREVFSFADGKILLSDQTRIAESCDAF